MVNAFDSDFIYIISKKLKLHYVLAFIFNLFIPMGFSFVDSSSSIQSLGEYHLTKSSIVQPGLAALKDSMSDTRQALCILALSWAPSDDVPSLQWNERLFTTWVPVLHLLFFSGSLWKPKNHAFPRKSSKMWCNRILVQ